MKKLLVFIIIFILSINITFAVSNDKEKKHKCKNLGMSKLNPKKAIRRNVKSLHRDMKMAKKIKKYETTHKKENIIMPKFR